MQADMRHYLQRSEISLEELNKLQIIHVAGTKGKGSTCAFAANISKQKGKKTGPRRTQELIYPSCLIKQEEKNHFLHFKSYFFVSRSLYFSSFNFTYGEVSDQLSTCQ